MSKGGIFTISIDTELAWGTFDHGGDVKYKDAYKKYRFIVAEVLKLFEEYDVPATWAVVGHLFLDACSRQEGVLHPDIVRPRHSWFKGDWFGRDPGTDISKDESWYGSDIVDMIMRARPRQEIGCHSFCHTIFSDKGCSAQTAASDVSKCVALAGDRGIGLTSFTFPRNSPAHLNVLSEYGFRVFRGKDAAFSALKAGLFRKAAALLADMLPVAPPAVKPEVALDGKLLEVRGSMLLRFAHGASRYIPRGVRLEKAKKGIDSAIRQGRVFHLWLHPISFAWRTQELLNEFKGILEYAARRRDEGRLKILNLREIGDVYLDGRGHLPKANFLDARGESDRYNPQAIALHNDRSGAFKEGYSDELALYHANAFKYGRKKIESALLACLSGLNGKSRVLDVGAGTGYYLNLMRRRGLDCVGVDLSENMLRQLKRTYPELAVQRADARQLPFSDGSFDAAVSVEVLRYFSDTDSFLKEVFRVLKPAGKLFVTAAPLFSMNAYGAFNTLCRLLNLRGFVSCFQSFETAGSLERSLRRAGFEVISVKGYFYGPYFLLDRACPGASAFFMKKLERFDDGLGQFSPIRNFSNHLVATARKPRDG